MVYRLVDYFEEEEEIEDAMKYNLRDNYLKYIPGTL